MRGGRAAAARPPFVSLDITQGVPVAQFIVVPQWQGSAAARAMLLADGANAIAGDLPARATRFVDVPAEVGDRFDTQVKGFGALEHVRAALADAIEQSDASAGPLIVIGGDASVTVSALAALPERNELALVWCSADAALQLPSPELGFDQQSLAAILGAGEPQLALDPPLAESRVLLVGARNTADDAEAAHAAALASVDPSDHDALASAADATGATGAWVHINLDVLDISEVEGRFETTPFGVASADLVHSLKALKREVPIVGASITGFAPRSADAATNDLGVILRLIGALA